MMIHVICSHGSRNMWEVFNICPNFIFSVRTNLIHFMNERKLLELGTLVMWWRTGMITASKGILAI